MQRHALRAVWLGLLCITMFGLSVRDASAQSCLGAIDGLVWLDVNQNGLRDPAEGSLGINGVVLEARNSSGTLVGTRTTGAAVGSIPGSYQFAFLCADSYTVTILSGVPAGYVPTISPPGADPNNDSDTSPTTVTIVSGQKEHAVNFGFVTGCTGSIGDRVWNDLNNNGVQDAGEPGIPGVTVRLNRDGSPVSSTTTDASGNYAFLGLCPGNYSVDVVTPAGFNPSPTFGTPDTALDSDASGVSVPLGLNEHNPTIDFGYNAPCTGRIGDRVWFDANRNGIQDAGELGIAGVTLELLDSGDNVIASTISGGTGDYVFTGLCAGSYSVRVVDATLPVGVVATLTSPPAGGNAANDSNPSPSAVVLTTGSSIDLTIDFGYYTPCTGTIGDRVWNDANANGIQDAGELGIPNVRVILRDSANNAVLGVDMTDASGNYLFEGLCLGNYNVEVDPTTLPGGMVASPNDQGANDAADSDGINHQALVSLPADNTTDLTIDFGYYRNAAIQIVKLTNGTDNNNPTGPLVAVGSTVTWTYNVTSTGSTEPLKDVVVVDDNGTPANTSDDFLAIFNSGDANGNGLLDVGETWTFVATGVATAGQYRNVATATGTGASSNTPVGPAQDPDHYVGVAGLRAIKTAAGSFTRRVTWTLTKTVSPSSYSGSPGQTLGTSTWSVTATKSVSSSNYGVSGTISVTNPNPFSVGFSVSDALNDGTAGNVTCPTTTAGRGATVVCTYTASPAGGSATLNTATITSLDSAVGGAVATAGVSFVASTVGDDAVALGDVRFNYSQLISGSSAPTFPETFTCPSNASSYTNGVYTAAVINTATLVGAVTNLTASATVNIRCTQNWGDETAVGAGTRYPGASNWFMYTPYTTSKVDLIAGQHYDAGDIYFTRTGSGATARTIITITLHAGFRWANVAEVLKIQPYATAPTTSLPPGQFQYKFTAPNRSNVAGATVSISGNTATVNLPGQVGFYGIHGAVQRLVP